MPPPNFFDDFIRLSESNNLVALHAKEAERQRLEVMLNAKEVTLNAKESERQRLEVMLNAKEVTLNAKESERQRLEVMLNAKEVTLNAKESERQRLEATLNAVYAGKSWRITLPLRKTANLVRWSARLLKRITRGIAKRIKAILKKSCTDNGRGCYLLLKG